MANPRADRPGLSVGEIHVWTVHLGDNYHVEADFLRILDHQERVRAAEFSFERDRGRFIQTHAAVRQILANYSGAAAAALNFARNCYGKAICTSGKQNFASRPRARLCRRCGQCESDPVADITELDAT